MADLSVEWPAGVDAEYFPQKIPDLYLGEPLFVTARLQGKVPARQTLIVGGTLNGARWQRELSVDTAQGGGTAGRPITDSSLASYWARQKIDSLLNAAFTGSGREPAMKEVLRRQVIDVALPFQLLSPYTSFVAVEKQVSRATAPPAKGAQGEPLLAAMTQQVQFPTTATAAGAWLLAGSLLLLCAALALLSLRREREFVRA